MAIKITSDSTCDLTKELLEKHDIELFPLYITLGGKTLRDGVEITPDYIFAHVAAGGVLASTAAVTPNDYETRFAQHFKRLFRLPPERAHSGGEL